MPIHKMNFEGGVFFAKQVGYIDNVDVRVWANALENYASEVNAPIAALVDMREVDRLCPSVLKIFARIVKIGNLCGVALVTSDTLVSRNARVIEKLSQLPGVLIFSGVSDAQQYASRMVRPSITPLSPSSLSTFSSLSNCRWS